MFDNIHERREQVQACAVSCGTCRCLSGGPSALGARALRIEILHRGADKSRRGGRGPRALVGARRDGSSWATGREWFARIEPVGPLLSIFFSIPTLSFSKPAGRGR